MKLPKVFVNPIDHEIKNDQEIYQDDRGENMDVEKYLNNLTTSSRILYMIDFIFNVNNREFIDRIAIYDEDYIITRSNKKIYLRDIKYIKETKKA